MVKGGFEGRTPLTPQEISRKGGGVRPVLLDGARDGTYGRDRHLPSSRIQPGASPYTLRVPLQLRRQTHVYSFPHDRLLAAVGGLHFPVLHHAKFSIAHLTLHEVSRNQSVYSTFHHVRRYKRKPHLFANLFAELLHRLTEVDPLRSGEFRKF